jgi:hypothetical protein
MGFSEGFDDQVETEPVLPEPVGQCRLIGRMIGRTDEVLPCLSAAVKAPQSRKQDIGMVRPRQLPNGQYECNHPCHDKTKCRHYW